MAGSKEAFVAIDAAKLRNAEALAENGWNGEVRCLAEFDATPEGMRRLAWAGVPDDTGTLDPSRRRRPRAG